MLSILLAVVLAVPLTSSPQAEKVRGDWFTDPDQALAAAEKAKKPVLAVAMDHG